MTAARQVIARMDTVGVRVGGRWLVRDIDLALRPGEIVTVVGPNGAGKTTLVKALLGLLPLTTGTVHRPRASMIGYVPQRLHIDPVLPLTVRRLVAMAGNVSARDVETVLERTGVLNRIDDAVSGLSGGEFQRVMLARALLRHLELLVLDEPAQGVDYRGEAQLYDLLADLRNERRVAILMVSHDLHVVMAASDRVVCLNGHICCSGTPYAVSENSAFRTLMGPRSETLAFYSHHHDHVHNPDTGCGRDKAR